MRKLAHIVAPFVVPMTSDLYSAQPITLETMRMAKRFAELTGHPAVDLYVTHFAEDAEVAPEDFIHTAVLERSTLDLGRFETPLKLPLIADILSRLYTVAVDADYLIYTNVDIGLLPNFYVTVDRLIERGVDALTINPRWIPEHFSDLADIPIMWAEGVKFRKGWDCFIFKREALPKMYLGDACLGAVNIGGLLLVNAILTAQNFTEFTDLHLTFHIGNEGLRKRMPMDDYRAHNLAILVETLHKAKAAGAVPDHPVFRRVVETMKAKGQLGADY
jgi:hypothetical protein